MEDKMNQGINQIWPTNLILGDKYIFITHWR